MFFYCLFRLWLPHAMFSFAQRINPACVAPGWQGPVSTSPFWTLGRSSNNWGITLHQSHLCGSFSPNADLLLQLLLLILTEPPFWTGLSLHLRLFKRGRKPPQPEPFSWLPFARMKRIRLGKRMQKSHKTYSFFGWGARNIIPQRFGLLPQFCYWSLVNSLLHPCKTQSCPNILSFPTTPLQQLVILLLSWSMLIIACFSSSSPAGLLQRQCITG